MKKILCSLLCVLLLYGCTDLKSKDVENEPLSISGFTCTLRTTFNGIVITANAQYTLPDTIMMDFTSPETVNGMQINCTGGEYTVYYKELEITVNSKQIPFDMVCRGLEECINNAQGQIPDSEETSESLVYSYTADGHTCKLYINRDTKEFQKIAIDGVDTLFFENFTYIYGTD